MADEVNDVATDENVDVEETTNSNEDSVEETQEDTEALQEKLDQTEKAKSQILARAKKAEDELKKLKESKTESHITNPDPYFEERIELLATGIPRKVLDEAQSIAKGKGITLTKAMEEPIVQTFQADLKEKERKEKAKLGASKGSGESQNESLVTEGMSREDHQKAFEKVMANTRT